MNRHYLDCVQMRCKRLCIPIKTRLLERLLARTVPSLRLWDALSPCQLPPCHPSHLNSSHKLACSSHSTNHRKEPWDHRPEPLRSPFRAVWSRAPPA